MVEEKMNYTIMQSLELRALIKTAIILWNQDDIRDLIAKVEVPESLPIRKQTVWQKIQDKVVEKVQELPLPESLKKKLSNVIQPIGFELLRLRAYCKQILLGKRDENFVRESLSNLCWTQQGTIDRKKMAEALIKDEKIDIFERYKLACNCCSKDDILMLWDKMPAFCKEYCEHPIHLSQNELLVFWTKVIKGEARWIPITSDRCTPSQYALENAAIDGNKVATEFFIQHLTPKKIAESLLRSALRDYDLSSNLVHFLEDYAGVYCSSLSQMRDKQQLKVLKKCSGDVLQSLLHWPWQGLFMETVKHMWAFLPKQVYYYLLLKIVTKVKNGYKDYNYQQLFREFWKQSSITHKEYVIYASAASNSLLLNLFQIKDVENIKLILEDATITDREKVIFSLGGKDICKSLIYDEEMDLVEYFVQECISSKDVMIKFREELKEYIVCQPPVETPTPEKEDKCNKFFLLLNGLIQTYD